MSVCLTHKAFQGAYSTFNAFRNYIAELAGYKVSISDNPDELPIPYPQMDYDIYNSDNYLGIWEKEPDDIILVLIVHSDCEGIIDKRHVGLLAERIEALLQQAFPAKQWWYLHEKAILFVEGLKRAKKRNQKITFS